MSQPTGKNGISGLIALLAGAHFSHHVLTALLAPLLPFIRTEFDLTYAQAGVVTSAFTVAYGVAQLPAGWVSDRVGPRYLLLVGISGVAVAGAVIGLSPAFPLLIAGLVLMGVTGGSYHPAATAVISRMVHPDKRGRALGLHIVGGSTSYFLAPIIAAGLVTAVGWRGSFLSLSAPVAILGIVMFWLISRRMRSQSFASAPEVALDVTRAAATDAPADTASTVASGGSRKTASMVLFLVLTGFIGAAIGTVIPFIPLYLTDVRGADERLAGALISMIFVSGFFAAPLGGWLSDRFGRVRIMILTGLLVGPAIALIVFVPFPVALSILLVFLGILMFTKMPTAEAHITSEVSTRHRTTVLGIYFFSGMEASAVLTPILGSVIDRWGFDVGIVGLAIGLMGIAIVCGFALLLLSRKR